MSDFAISAPALSDHQASGDGRTQLMVANGRATPPLASITPEAVLRSFNTWHFKREQPSDSHAMVRVISEAISMRAAVPFILYWGKGPRCRLAEPDVQCLTFLSALSARVRAVYALGAAITLIFTDTHADLNGHSPQTFQRYFADVEESACQRGFETCRLGSLVSARDATAVADADDDAPAKETLQQLCFSAAKWYQGEGTSQEGALRYYRMNMIERRAVELAFPRSIFVTFNGSKLRGRFPKNLPIFYMYSLRRGVSVKPWFLPADVRACEAASCHCAGA